jgi:hypothetical protein
MNPYYEREKVTTLIKLLNDKTLLPHTYANGFTTLHYVIDATPHFIPEDTAVRLVNHLVSVGTGVNAKTNEDGDTPLMMTTDKSMDVMEALLEQGADIDATNRRGRSVVNQAILLGQFEKAARLIRYGATITKDEIDKLEKVRPGQLDSIYAAISARAELIRAANAAKRASSASNGGRRRKTRKARKTHKNRKYSHKKN